MQKLGGKEKKITITSKIEQCSFTWSANSEKNHAPLTVETLSGRTGVYN